MNTTQPETTCPMCHSQGWPSALHLAAFMGECGTTWGAFAAPRQAPACRTIAGLRFQVDLLELAQVAS